MKAEMKAKIYVTTKKVKIYVTIDKKLLTLLFLISVKAILGLLLFIVV